MGRSLPRRSNPGAGDLLTLLAVGWVAFSPAGRNAVHALLPDLFKLGANAGLPGDGQVPTTPTFLLSAAGLGADVPAGPIAGGTLLTFVVRLLHRGPAGAYAVGVDLATAPLGFGLFGRNPPFQQIERLAQVNDDANLVTYESSFQDVYSGSGLGLVEGHFYVRGEDGTVYAERTSSALFVSV